MEYPRKERRKFDRFDTEAKIFFHVNYDLKTRLKYRVLSKNKPSLKKYSGLSRDVSVAGIRFSSDKKLKKGDVVYLEMYLPGQDKPILMSGKVRWSLKFSNKKSGYKFDTGVLLLKVSGKSVSKSIYFDKKHLVYWGIVLEAVFGTFRKFMKDTK